MKGRSAFALAVAALAFAVSPGLTPVLGELGTARAACGDEPSEPEAIFAFQPPSQDFEISGPAPLAVRVTWLAGVVIVAGTTASLSWGDGSAPTAFSAQDCGDETISWPVQSHSHTYAAPGQYQIVWNVNAVFASLTFP